MFDVSWNLNKQIRYLRMVTNRFVYTHIRVYLCKHFKKVPTIFL